MKNSLLALTCALALLSSSCSEGEVSAKDAMDKVGQAAGDMASKVKDIDLSALSPEAAKAKVSEWSTELGNKLGEIKDKASAESIVKSFQPVADKLAQAKQMLGDKMPSMEALKTKVNELKQKFAGDKSVMDVLEPLIDKLQTLFQG